MRIVSSIASSRFARSVAIAYDPLFFDDGRCWPKANAASEPDVLGFSRVRYGAPPPRVRVHDLVEPFRPHGWGEVRRVRVDDDRYAVGSRR